jgi:hypothetical protein
VISKTGAHEHRVFAGKLDKSRMTFADRAMVTAFRSPEGDFRDWEEIAEWADDIAEAEVNRDGASWGISEVGMLAAILLSFENRIPILKDGRFDEKDGELVLVAPWGMGSEVPLVNRVQGSTLDGNGGVKVRSSLATLHRNNWLVVEQSVSEIRIRLGERAKKLRSPAKRKEG